MLGSSDDVAQTGFILLLGREVNSKSMGASLERSVRDRDAIRYYTREQNPEKMKSCEMKHTQEELEQRRCRWRTRKCETMSWTRESRKSRV